MDIFTKTNTDVEDKIAFRVVSAAKATGLSVSHLNYLIKTKKLRSYLPSPKIRIILKDDLIEYIKSTGVNSDEN